MNAATAIPRLGAASAAAIIAITCLLHPGTARLSSPHGSAVATVTASGPLGDSGTSGPPWT